MSSAAKIHTFAKKAVEAVKAADYAEDSYPRGILDIVIFHKLHMSMDAAVALRSYRALREDFVDWNEVRVSTVREIQETLKGCDDSVGLAVFLKDFLEHVQRENHRLSLEHLVEESLTDIRRFFKPIKGIDPATPDLILYLRKDHPVLPLNAEMDGVVQRLGIARGASTRDRRQRRLHEVVKPECLLALHHFLLDFSRHLEAEEKPDWTPTRVRKLCEGFLAAKGKTSRPGKSRAKASKTSDSGRKVIRKAVTAKRVRKSS